MTTNDSIQKIKAAEEKAASVREGAVSAAKALVVDASSSAEKRFADESAKAAEEKKANSEHILSAGHALVVGIGQAYPAILRQIIVRYVPQAAADFTQGKL